MSAEEGFGAGRWLGCLLVGGFSVGFRLVVKAFQSVFDWWVGFSVENRLVGSGVPVCGRSWWGLGSGEDAGIGLVHRWLVYRMCIRDALLRIVAPDRRVCTLRIACVYGKRIGTEQRSDVVS